MSNRASNSNTFSKRFDGKIRQIVIQILHPKMNENRLVMASTNMPNICTSAYMLDLSEFQPEAVLLERLGLAVNNLRNV